LIQNINGEGEESDMEAGIEELDDTPMTVAGLLVEATCFAKFRFAHSTQACIQRAITCRYPARSWIVQVVIINLHTGLFRNLFIRPSNLSELAGR